MVPRQPAAHRLCLSGELAAPSLAAGTTSLIPDSFPTPQDMQWLSRAFRSIVHHKLDVATAPRFTKVDGGLLTQANYAGA